MLTGEQLRLAFVDEAMLGYFRCKLPAVSADELTARLEETLKFLSLAHECTSAIPVSPEIDEVWHLWILQTQQYMALCERLPSGGYIHHSSNDYLRWFDPSVDSAQPLHEDVRMLALRAANFGPFEPDRVRHWLLADHLVRRCGWSVEQLNEWLLPSRPADALPPPQSMIAATEFIV